MKRIVGIDLSLTSTGIAIQDDDEVRTARVGSAGKAGAPRAAQFARFQQIADLIIGHITERESEQIPLRGTRVYIEGPSYGSPNGVFDLAGNWWNLYGRLWNMGLDIVVVSPSSLKQWATGKGNAGKDQVLLAVARNYPDVEIANNDVADAVVLCDLGATLHGQRFSTHPVSAGMQKALDTVGGKAA